MAAASSWRKAMVGLALTLPLIGTGCAHLGGGCASCGHEVVGPNKKCHCCKVKSCHAMDICAVDAMPRELDKVSMPEYVVEPPDILFIETIRALPTQPLGGEKLVRTDGTINLGYYGDLHVAGLTLAEIEEKIEARLKHYVRDPRVHVDVAAFNSKVFYVMGQVVEPGRIPFTGNETVLDAVTLAGGLTNYSDECAIKVVRPTPICSCDVVLPVDWEAIVNCGDTTTNYQLMPGDRVVVPATAGFDTAVWLDNVLTPVERVLGVINLFRLAVESDSSTR